MTKTISVLRTVLVMSALVFGVTNVDAAKKPKGLVIPEGDKAQLTTVGNYNVITLPETLDEADMELYNTDFVGYIMKINGKINTEGNSWAGSQIYYYVHNSKEWLHKGQYDNPAQLNVTRIKSFRISKFIMRLREFNKEMPLLNDSRDMKNDQGYQNEIREGETKYTFIEITLRD